MVKNLLQCRGLKFDSWVGKISLRRKRLPTPVFLPGQSHGQWSLMGYSPWGHKELDPPAHSLESQLPPPSHPDSPTETPTSQQGGSAPGLAQGMLGRRVRTAPPREWLFCDYNSQKESRERQRVAPPPPRLRSCRCRQPIDAPSPPAPEQIGRDYYASGRGLLWSRSFPQALE